VFEALGRDGGVEVPGRELDELALAREVDAGSELEIGTPTYSQSVNKSRTEPLMSSEPTSSTRAPLNAAG
jgi:hypothetical protein